MDDATGAENSGDGLGSLTQAARSKQLNSAKGILLVIGVLTILANGVFFFLAEKMVNDQFAKELAQLRGQGMIVDDAEVEKLKAESIRTTRLVNGFGLLIGVTFIVLGCIVKKYPVPVTITGLVLYLGAAAVFGLIDPQSLVRGLLIKILIIVGLFKAIQAAIAYEKESKSEADQYFSPSTLSN